MRSGRRHRVNGEKAAWLSVALVVCACLLTGAIPADALELWSDASGERSVSLNTSLKWTSVLSHASGDTVFFPEEWSAASLWRFRAVVEARPTTWLAAQIAYEQRARTISEGAGAARRRFPLPTV